MGIACSLHMHRMLIAYALHAHRSRMLGTGALEHTSRRQIAHTPQHMQWCSAHGEIAPPLCTPSALPLHSLHTPSTLLYTSSAPPLHLLHTFSPQGTRLARTQAHIAGQAT